MAYITAEQVTEKRNQIKAAFPATKGWKFSIRKRDYSSIEVTILQGPIDFKIKNKNPEFKNDYYARRDECFGTTSINNDNLSVTRNGTEIFVDESKKVLDEIYKIMDEGNYNNSRIEVDYFDVGWYSNLSVGSWDKPYRFNKKS